MHPGFRGMNPQVIIPLIIVIMILKPFPISGLASLDFNVPYALFGLASGNLLLRIPRASI